MTAVQAPVSGGPAGRSDSDDRPRAIVRAVSPGDRVFRAVLRAGGGTVLLITGLIALFLILKSWSALRRAGWHFLTRTNFLPARNDFGIGSLLPNGLIIAAIALVIAVPFAIATAIFISEYASGWVQRSMIAVVDLMAAVPSVIYALFAVDFLQTRVPGTFRWMSEHLSFIPIFRVPGAHDENDFTTSSFLAGFVVSLMVIPLITSICREVYSQTPPGEREAAYALGSSRWGMVRTVVLPYGRAGTIGAIMLGFGRAIGETIVVTLIISPVYVVQWHVLGNGGNSIPAYIALHTEATQQTLEALLAAGLALFVVTLLVNAAASVIVTRSRSGAQTVG